MSLEEIVSFQVKIFNYGGAYLIGNASIGKLTEIYIFNTFNTCTHLILHFHPLLLLLLGAPFCWNFKIFEFLKDGSLETTEWSWFWDICTANAKSSCLQPIWLFLGQKKYCFRKCGYPEKSSSGWLIKKISPGRFLETRLLFLALV